MNKLESSQNKSIGYLRRILALLFLTVLVPGVRAVLIPVPSGFSMIANQLNAVGGNTLNNVMPLPIDGSAIITWGCSPPGFATYLLYDSGFGGWVDINFNPVNPATVPLPPGIGFAFFNPGPATTIDLSPGGAVPPPGPIVLPCGAGNYSLVARPDYNAGPSSYNDIMGPPVGGERLKKWSGTTWIDYAYYGGAWNVYTPYVGWAPGVPTMGPGEAVLIKTQTIPNGVGVLIMGPALTAPAITRSYVLAVYNNGPGVSTPVTVQCDGIPLAPGMFLTAPGIIGGPTQGFQVNVPALAVGATVNTAFTVTTGTQPVGSSFTLNAFFLTTYFTTDALLVNVVASVDPNDKLGPLGIGPKHYLAGNTKTNLPYVITFENLPAATAPAQVVVITDKLDPTRLSLGSFQLGPMMFGSKVVTPPQGLDVYSITVPYDVDGIPGTTADNIDVHIDAGLDSDPFSSDYGKVTWTFQSYVAGTQTAPPLSVGFLPPNQTPPQGQGAVTFKVDRLSSLGTGDIVTNSASIVFDNNAAIATGTWTNTIIDPVASLMIEKVVGQVKVTWPTWWVLEEASSLVGPWTNSAVQVSPWTFPPAESEKLYRLRAP